MWNFTNDEKVVCKYEYINADMNYAEQVYKLVQTTIKNIYPKYYPKEVVDFFFQHHSKDNIEADIRNGCVSALVVNNQIVGTGSYNENHITRVYVLPDYQGQGYGSYIMQKLENEIAKAYDKVYLDASLPACRLYEHRGYRTKSHEKHDVENGVVLVYEVMEKDLLKPRIRELREDEYELLDDFLYEAIFIPEGIDPPPKTIIMEPELQVYVKDFGKEKDDICFVAEVDNKVIGAVWVRNMDDYGHIEEGVPSFAISLYKEYRGYGIGTELMEKMLVELKKRGYKKASLAVQKANYAVKMYKNVGFEIMDENEEEYIMVCQL